MHVPWRKTLVCWEVHTRREIEHHNKLSHSEIKMNATCMFQCKNIQTCGIDSSPSAFIFSFIIATLARVDSDLAPLLALIEIKVNENGCY